MPVKRHDISMQLRKEQFDNALLRLYKIQDLFLV